MSNYQTLFSITVEHDYFQGGACNSLEFIPTEKTTVLCENAGMLCKNKAAGMQVIYDKDRLEALQMYARDPREVLSFDFKIYSRDSDFRSYTEPFAAASDGLLYFDNLTTSGSKAWALSASDQVSGLDFKQFDASELKPVLSPKDRLLPPVFTLRIFSSNKQGSLLAQWLDPEPVLYLIRFASRQRYWKYYLLGRLMQQRESKNPYLVVDADRQVEFEAMGEEQLSDQRRAYTFRSKRRLPLHEQYPYRFQLIQRERNGETVVIDSLPVASIKQFGMDTVAEQASFVSEIYINS